MMSSATQTEGAGKGAEDEQSAAPPSGLPVSPAALAWGLGIVALLGGWISILQVYRWHFTAPVFFLFAGWLSVLLSARYLWRAGMAAAEDTGMSDDEFWKPVGPQDELMREKRSLLKAIKEIEFDHQMGKMSEEDATQLTRFYRLRAIELIKAMESDGEGEGDGLSVKEQIEREVKARLTVSRTGAKAQASGAQSASDSKAPAKSAGAGKHKGKKKRAKDEKAPAGEAPSSAAADAGETSAEASTEVGS